MNYRKLLPVLALTLNAITFDTSAASAALGAESGEGGGASKAVVAPRKGIFSHNPADHPRGKAEIYADMAAAMASGSTVTPSALRATLQTDLERVTECANQLNMSQNMLGGLLQDLIRGRADLARASVVAGGSAASSEVEKFKRAIDMVQDATALIMRDWESALTLASLLDGILTPMASASGGEGAAASAVAASATGGDSAFMESIRSLLETRSTFLGSKGVYAKFLSAASPDVSVVVSHVEAKIAKYNRMSAQLARYGDRMHLDTDAAQHLLSSDAYTTALRVECAKRQEGFKDAISESLRRSYITQAQKNKEEFALKLLDPHADKHPRAAGATLRSVANDMNLSSRRGGAEISWMNGYGLMQGLGAILEANAADMSQMHTVFARAADAMTEVFMEGLLAPEALAAGAVEHNVDGLALPLHVLKARQAKWTTRLTKILDL